MADVIWIPDHVAEADYRLVVGVETDERVHVVLEGVAPAESPRDPGPPRNFTAETALGELPFERGSVSSSPGHRRLFLATFGRAGTAVDALTVSLARDDAPVFSARAERLPAGATSEGPAAGVWVADPDHPAVGSGDFRLLVGAESHGILYVLIQGPLDTTTPPDPERHWLIQTRSAGRQLAVESAGARFSRRGRALVHTEFEAPPAAVRALDVTLHHGDELLLSVGAVRLADIRE